MPDIKDNREELTAEDWRNLHVEGGRLGSFQPRPVERGKVEPREVEHQELTTEALRQAILTWGL